MNYQDSPRESQQEYFGREKQKWNDIFLEDCAVYDKKIAEEYKTLQERIAELEKANEMQALRIKERDELLADVKKENVELKNDNIEWEKANDKWKKLYFATQDQLTKAKDHIKKLLDCLQQDTNDPQTNYYVCQYMDKAEQFLNSEVEK